MKYTILFFCIILIEVFIGICLAIMEVMNISSLFNEIIFLQLYITILTITILILATVWFFEMFAIYEIEMSHNIDEIWDKEDDTL